MFDTVEKPQYDKDEFLALQDSRSVADLFQISFPRLMFLLNLTGKQNFRPRYQEIFIPKKSGGLRSISIPNRSLLRVQKLLSDYLYQIYNAPLASHGYVKKFKDKKGDNISKSIVSNAKAHKKSYELLHVDLKDFFPSITGKRVFNLFKKAPFNFSNSVAGILTEICVHDQTKSLPQGAATSPVISNMLAHRLDIKLVTFSKQFNVFYTRYVDDLTFSSKRPDAFTELFISTLYKLIESEGFAVNEAKVRKQSRMVRQEVTGLIINSKVNVQRTYIRNIRAMLHNLKVHGLAQCQSNLLKEYSVHSNLSKRWVFTSGSVKENEYVQSRIKTPPDFLAILKGKIEFIGSVRGKSKGQDEYEMYGRLKNDLDKIIKSVKPTDNSHNNFYIEEKEGEGDLRNIANQFE